MLRNLIVLIFLFITFQAQAGLKMFDGPVNIGDKIKPDPSTILQLDSKTRGFAPPRMTEVQRDAIVAPIDGLVIYNTDTFSLNLFKSSAWGASGGGGADHPLWTTTTAYGVGAVIIDDVGSFKVYRANTGHTSDATLFINDIANWDELSDLTLIGGITGAITFLDANGKITQDADNFFWDVATSKLSIGTNIPTETITVSGIGGNSSNIGLYTFTNTASNFPSTRLNRSRGTMAVPTRVFAGDVVAKWDTRAHNSTVFAASSFMQSIVTESFSGIAGAANLEFHTNPIGSAPPLLALTLEDDQSSTFEGTLNTPRILVISTVEGSRPCPPMTGAQRDAISTPVSGDCIFNSTTNQLNVYDGTIWGAVGGGISAWVTAFNYIVGDVVHESNKIYLSLTIHTSGTFATDLGNSDWFELSDDLNRETSVTDNAVTRWDGTGGDDVQNSLLVITDGGVASGLTQILLDNLDINGNTLTTTSGSLIISADNSIINVPGITPNRFVITDGSSNLGSQEFISLTSDITGTLTIANGGTNSSTALNNNFVIVSVAGAIVESTAISTAEIGLLNGRTYIPDAVGTNNQVATFNGTNSVDSDANFTNNAGVVGITGSLAVDQLNFNAATISTDGGSPLILEPSAASIFFRPETGQTYQLEMDGASALAFQGLSTGSGSTIALFSSDNDETDSVSFVVKGSGQPDSANFHSLAMEWNATNGQYELHTGSGGTGTVRDLSIFAGVANLNQIFLEHSSNFVSISGSGPASELDVNGDLTLSGEGELRLADNTGGETWGLKAPAALSGTTLLTVPDGVGSNGQVLTTDGASTLTWSSAILVESINTVSANYTILDGDGFTTILVDDTSSDRTITPPTVAANSARVIRIKNISTNGGDVVVDGEGSEEIDGETTLLLNSENDVVVMQSIGASWKIIGGRIAQKFQLNILTVNVTSTDADNANLRFINMDIGQSYELCGSLSASMTNLASTVTIDVDHNGSDIMSIRHSQNDAITMSYTGQGSCITFIATDTDLITTITIAGGGSTALGDASLPRTYLILKEVNAAATTQW